MSAKGVGGRPTKLTPEAQKAILAFISVGAPVHVACAAAGINKDTYFHWLKLSESGRSEFKAFQAAVEQANATAVIKNVRTISRAAQGGAWQAAAWWLERRFPDEWARTERHEMTGANGGPITVADFFGLALKHDSTDASGSSGSSGS
jgi:transposase